MNRQVLKKLNKNGRIYYHVQSLRYPYHVNEPNIFIQEQFKYYDDVIFYERDDALNYISNKRLEDGIVIG